MSLTNVHDSSTSPIQATARTWANECFWAFLGACFIATLAQVNIPLYPVPMTLQTLAVGLLIAKNPHRAFFSTLFYLGMITLGFPVLAGGASQALWLFRPTMGYLLAMPLGALLSGRLLTKTSEKSSWMRHFGVLALYYYGCSLTLGSILLSLMLSSSLKFAFLVGFVPFIIPEAVKLFAVLSLARLWKK